MYLNSCRVNIVAKTTAHIHAQTHTDDQSNFFIEYNSIINLKCNLNFLSKFVILFVFFFLFSIYVCYNCVRGKECSLFYILITDRMQKKNIEEFIKCVSYLVLSICYRERVNHGQGMRHVKMSRLILSLSRGHFIYIAVVFFFFELVVFLSVSTTFPRRYLIQIFNILIYKNKEKNCSLKVYCFENYFYSVFVMCSICLT